MQPKIGIHVLQSDHFEMIYPATLFLNGYHGSLVHGIKKHKIYYQE